MSRSTYRHRWAALVLVAAVAVLAPKLRNGETDKYLDTALQEIARRSNIDPAALEGVREAAKGILRAPEQGDNEAALKRLARELQKNKLVPVDEDGRLKLDAEPAKRYGALAEPTKTHGWLKERGLARRLIETLSSDIRRRSILDEIGGGRSEELTRDRLMQRLKTSQNVPDFEHVVDSFDHHRAPGVAKTLEEKTTLLRLYGGESMPMGRYFFCCRWARNVFGGVWSDATGLAMPRGNLKSGLALVTLPAGTTVFIGIVADNFANFLRVKAKGGNTQIFVPNVEASELQVFRAIDGSMPRDIAVVGHDRVLWFRPVSSAGS